MKQLGPDEHARLAEDGYVVVPGLVDGPVLERAFKAAAAMFPSVADGVADPMRHRIGADGLAFRSFPYPDPTLSRVGLDERLIDFTASAFEVDSVFLTQSLVRATYPHPGSKDQCLHRDYTDNGLLVPSDDPRFGQLAILIYLTDVGLEHAPTHLCSRSQTDDRPLLPRQRCRDLDPELYDIEQPIVGSAGTAVIYTMATFHRGSKFTAVDDWRLVMHLVYRPSGNEWTSFMAFGTSFEREGAVELMASLSPKQRSALGVPPPGHPYWTPATIAGVAGRYPGMDTSPYTAALG